MSKLLQKLSEIASLLCVLVKFLTISIFILIPNFSDRTEAQYLYANVPIACLFVFFSSLAWMELKNRFLFENSSNISGNASEIQQKTFNFKKSTPSANFFQILEFNIGTYLTGLICLVNVIYGLSFYSLSIQFLFDEVFLNSTSLYQDVFINSSATNHNDSIQPLTLDSIKLIFNLIYFPFLLFLAAYKKSCKQKYPNVFFNLAYKFLKTLLFITFASFTVYLTSSSLFSDHNCEKPTEEDFYSNLLSVLIFSSCFYHLIFKEFTHLKKKNKLFRMQLNSEKFNYKSTSRLWKLCKNLIVTMLLFASTTILYLATRNYSSHNPTKECQRFIQFKLALNSPWLDKLSVLLTCIFIVIIVSDQVMDFVIENSLSVLRVTVRSAPLSLFFKIALSLLFITLSSLKILFLSKHSLLYFWSLSFLLNNFLVTSTVLLINYFPYQVINYWNQSRKNLSANRNCSDKEEIPLYRQQSKREIDFGELRLKNEIESPGGEQEPKNMDIENIVLEHLREIHNRLILDKNLCLTKGQPSMNVGYQALVGFFLFSLLTSLEMLIINSTGPTLSKKEMYASIGMLVTVLFLQLFVAFFFIIRNDRETIYIKKLCMRMPFVPYSNLVICFLTVVLALCISQQLVLVFLIELFLLSTIVLVAYHYSSQIKRCASLRFLAQNKEQDEEAFDATIVSIQNTSKFPSDSSKLHIVGNERF